MDKEIPTARIFLQNLIEENNYDSNIDIEDAMIEFAKLHVEAALIEASENAKIIDVGKCVVYKFSILNAYPLTNIK